VWFKPLRDEETESATPANLFSLFGANHIAEAPVTSSWDEFLSCIRRLERLQSGTDDGPKDHEVSQRRQSSSAAQVRSRLTEPPPLPNQVEENYSPGATARTQISRIILAVIRVAVVCAGLVFILLLRQVFPIPTLGPDANFILHTGAFALVVLGMIVIWSATTLSSPSAPKTSKPRRQFDEDQGSIERTRIVSKTGKASDESGIADVSGSAVIIQAFSSELVNPVDYSGCMYKPQSQLPYPKEEIRRALIQVRLEWSECDGNGLSGRPLQMLNAMKEEALKSIDKSLFLLDNYLEIDAHDLPKEPVANLAVGMQHSPIAKRMQQAGLIDKVGQEELNSFLRERQESDN
jgi:hypothetical protein